LELPILEVRYEQVVNDLEGQARRMIEFLQLPWDPQCLRYYENPRPVATASSGQVRLPIYRRSVGRWRHYDRHLAPLRAALSGHPPDVSYSPISPRGDNRILPITAMTPAES
jgi:hypothetical protein